MTATAPPLALQAVLRAAGDLPLSRQIWRGIRKNGRHKLHTWLERGCKREALRLARNLRGQVQRMLKEKLEKPHNFSCAELLQKQTAREAEDAEEEGDNEEDEGDDEDDAFDWPLGPRRRCRDSWDSFRGPEQPAPDLFSSAADWLSDSPTTAASGLRGVDGRGRRLGRPHESPDWNLSSSRVGPDAQGAFGGAASPERPAPNPSAAAVACLCEDDGWG